VHHASSSVERVRLIEDFMLKSLHDMNERTNTSGHTLLTRIAQTFLSAHHPS
jgi:hypothetical protein